MSKNSTPTNTSELADRMRQRQEREQREIEALLSEHAERCRTLSSSMLLAFENDMEKLRRQSQRRIRRSVWPLAWIWALALIAVLVAAAAIGWTYWQAQTLMRQQQTIVQRQKTLAKLPNIHLAQCGKADRACVKINPSAPQNWGDYRILAGN